MSAWRILLQAVADAWAENVERFSEIDSAYGDGDHGVTMGKIARLISREVGSPGATGETPGDATTIKQVLRRIGNGVMAIGGGSAGPLYGTLFLGLAAPLDPGAQATDAATLAAMIVGARAELSTITKARVGDKTMVDALAPAAEAAWEARGDGIVAVLGAAAQAAAEGADATANMIARFGRARSYGEQTVGTPDAGALSTSLLFKGLNDGLAKLGRA
ncbi:MAG: DAK2 domain-containing protein [Bifidobacteriaceae bacterium]|nr:DAK2 domain-containing protein [Bifidobacteriaceae bacterium]